MIRISYIIFFCLLAGVCFGQYSWKLEKDKNGIKVYKSDVRNSVFKAIKVECTLTGNYEKLASILTNVPHLSDWIYNSKNTRLLKQNNSNDIIYYSETYLPWPLSNRDAVIHLQIKTDSLPHFLTITGNSKPGMVSDLPGKVRITHYRANWKVTMPTPNTIRINYILELDPGGSIPGWVANMFAEKGPYGTFSNLARRLME